MRIFSNFDTQYVHKVLAEKQERYAKDGIFLVRRSKYFFLLYVFPHFLGYIALLVIAITIFMYYQLPWYFFWVLFCIWWAVIWFRIVWKFLHYICDFTIITPGWITTYKQKWLMNCVLKEISSRRIKSIEVRRTTIFSNVFWFWTLDIITDAQEFSSNIDDDSNDYSWSITLSYVDSPQDVKACISKICFH